jgi:DNA-binding response OmpR family regulator
MARILVIDGDRALPSLLDHTLQQEGHERV